MMVQQNKWRAARFGNHARLVDTYTYESASVAEVVERLAALLEGTAEELGCVEQLLHCTTMARQSSAAQRQLDLFTETNEPREVVRRLTDASRIGH
jgi:carboxylate-amine ligase